MGQRILRGVPVVGGVAVGHCWWLRSAAKLDPVEAEQVPGDPFDRLERARAAARTELEQLIASARGRLPESEIAILHAQLLMIDDPELERAYREGIEQGKAPAVSWQEAVTSFHQVLSSLPDPTLQARAADVKDIGARVLRHLTGTHASPAMPESPVILCADDLAPSELVAFPSDRLLGIALSGGGPTSHVAILARALGVPTIMGLGESLHLVTEGTFILLDGNDGRLVVDPDPEEVREVLAMQQARDAEQQRAL